MQHRRSNPFSLIIKFVNGWVVYHNFGGFKIKWVTPTLFCLLVIIMQSMKVDNKPRLSLLSWFEISLYHTSTESSFVQLSVHLPWLSGNIFGSYGYLKIAMSDRVAIEKSVGSQLAVPMNLDIRQNQYMAAILRNLLS